MTPLYLYTTLKLYIYSILLRATNLVTPHSFALIIGFIFIYLMFTITSITEVVVFVFVVCAAYAVNIKLDIVIDDYLPFKFLQHIPFQFLETFILSCILGNLLQIILI